MGKVHFNSKIKPPIFRKVAVGTWSSVGDPSVYGILEIDMTQALKILNKKNEDGSLKITPTHLVAKAIAMSIQTRPEINAIIRFNKIYYRKSVDIFFQVNVDGSGDQKISKANLSGTVLRSVDQLSLDEISKQLSHKSKELRSGKDPEFAQTFKLFKFIPWWAAKLVLNIFSFINYELNLNLSFLGLPKDPFGSVMVTSVGSLGIDLAFAPLVPYSKVPLLLSVGRINDEVKVIDGKIEIRPIMKIGVTFDHRLIDGVHAAELAKSFKEYFANL